MIFKKDNLKLGLVLGLLAPLVGMTGFYYWKFKAISFIEFFQFLALEKRLITNMVTFSLLANAIIFTIYVNSGKDNTAKGIFIVTCAYAVAAITLKLCYGS